MSGNLTVTVLKDGASAVNNLTFDANGNTTAGGTVAMASSYLRNRIINGAMQIDQRYAGAAFGTSINGYTIDRFALLQSTTGKLNGQQNFGSITPPVGFSNYLGFQSQSAYSVLASDYYMLYQAIEGLNIADLAWGTANAKTVTLSFQIYSSLTGTFGGSIANSTAARTYPFSYTVSSANTWTSVSVTIPGDTSGTWLTTTGVGIVVRFGLGAGSTYLGTSGAWAGANYVQPTGTVSVVGTNAATFYITGVQLEVGTVATPFERRLYGQELMLCQRYYYRITATSGTFGDASAHTTTSAIARTTFPVTMRIAPSSLDQSGTAGNYAVYFASTGTAASVVPAFRDATTNLAQTTITVASGLTAGQAGFLYANNGTPYLGWSAEL